jgi:hypothetical protein
MSYSIYFDTESPDYNLGLWGKPERQAANRFILCLMTEFGMINNRKMQARQVHSVIETIQFTSMSKK